MARYIPAPVSGTLESYLRQELEKIAQAMETADERLTLAVQYKAPDKFRAGTVVAADGTTWNPGSGKGMYWYDGTNWKFLG